MRHFDADKVQDLAICNASRKPNARSLFSGQRATPVDDSVVLVLDSLSSPSVIIASNNVQPQPNRIIELTHLPLLHHYCQDCAYPSMRHGKPQAHPQKIYAML
jgi:hypothetical protein